MRSSYEPPSRSPQLAVSGSEDAAAAAAGDQETLLQDFLRTDPSRGERGTRLKNHCKNACCFLGQTKFVVNETSTSVIRLIIERTGTPANVTAVLLLQGEDTGDFEGTSAVAQLLTTETNKTVYIAVKDDDFPEADETFVFSLRLQGTSADVMLGIPNIATVTILSNDNAFGIVSFNMSSIVILDEARNRNECVPLTLIRMKGTYGTITVYFVITAGPNSADEDISPARGNIILPPGRAVVVFNLSIIDDQIPENDEVFTVQLMSAEGGAEINATQSSFQLKINKNDSPVRLARALYTVSETDDVITIPVIRGKDQSGKIIGSDDALVSINYQIVTGNSSASALLQSDFIDLHPNRTIIFPPYVYEVNLKFQIINDPTPEIAESFQIVLLEDTIKGDAVLIAPNTAQIIIEPNDKPHGVLSISSGLLAQNVVINEDMTTRFDGITIVRNGGTHGNVSVNWLITRNGSDSTAVTVDLMPASGTLNLVEGQMLATVHLTIINDNLPEEAEAYLFQLLNSTIKGGAELDEPMQLESVELENHIPLVASVSPRLGPPLNISRTVTPDLANGEVGFTSNETLLVYEPENSSDSQIYVALQRDGTDGSAEVYWHLRPTGVNHYNITSDDLSPVNGSVMFLSGQSNASINITIKSDDLPEINETLIISLDRTNPENQVVKSGFTSRKIIILQNDDPGGVFEFSPQTKGPYFVNEGVAFELKIIRYRGALLKQFLRYVVEPKKTFEFYGNTGVLEFDPGEREIAITLLARQDDVPEIPEEIETFTVILWNTTGGAKLGSVLNATLLITKNDDPIYFEDPIVLRVQEGSVANFTVARNGSVDFVAAVVYNVESEGTSNSAEDIIPLSENNTLVFEIGERTKAISVVINEDNVPETDETFYIVLVHSTGDTVVYGTSRATVIIEANDDPNGIFSLEALEKLVFEGMTNNFMILRQRGKFGNVSISWQLFINDSFLEPGQEFSETSGIVLFTTGERARPITLYALADGIPEFNEIYILRLLSASGGFPGPGAQLSNGSLSANVVIPFNDDPFGVFILDPESQDREIAEDILSTDDMSHITNFTILRHKGTFGDVRIGWEILTNAFRHGLPEMTDFILVATFPSSVELRPHAKRHHTGTDALYFSGAEGVYGTINPEHHPRMNNTLANFTLSAWVIPNPNTDGFIISKTNNNGSIYYAVKVMTNESSASVMFHYTLLGSNVPHVTTVTTSKHVEEKTWMHIIIMVDDGLIEFYLDGTLLPDGIKSLKGETIADGPGVLTVGADADGKSRFSGLMQDVRLYVCKLNRAEIHEIHSTPAKTDLHPISGYLEYRQGEKKKSFIVAAKDDSEEEGEESFTLKINTANGGARISHDNATARLRIQKSDNANGLFGFTGTCIPQTSDEGSTISCVVERTRGTLDSVYVNYSISQIEVDSSNISDLVNLNGIIAFYPSQSSEVLNVHVVDDDLPELAEHFIVSLVSAISGDGKVGSTPTSGASIDPEKASTEITIKSSDHPNGLLQFSTKLPPDNKAIIHPALSVPSITVKEEVGLLRLLVVRAQGLLGNIMVAYQTVPLTASSPSDYQHTAGILDFKPGEQYKYITVNITDDSVPELPKRFQVVLLNSKREVAELLGMGASGSGDGEVEFFLPAFHIRASLGIASEILVIIDASDDAHGVFQFSNDSLHLNGTEPEGGHEIVLLEVVRTEGALSQTTLFWDVVSDPYNNLVNIHGNVTFEIGQSLASIVLQVASDEVPELDEEFMIYISNVSKGRMGILTNATLTVLANDDPYGVFIFSARSRPVRVEEEDQNVTLTIERLNGFKGIALVMYSTVDDTKSTNLPYFIARGTEGRDYFAISGSVIFEANQTAANVTISILDDVEPERPESVFVQLHNVVLLKGEQARPIAGSPRLGPKNDIMAHVIINANDDAFGTLQLSTSAVRVSENYIGPIINVTRTGGIFADVSVKFRALSMTARVGEDYSIASSDVILLEGETSKAVPIYLLNDIIPELEESFRIELINETTGGAVLGAITEATITIEASDDPYGSFVFERTEFIVEEPESNTTKINLSIVRNAGTLGAVTVQWIATMNEQQITSDLQVALGEVTFTPGQSIQTLQVELLADDFPEIEEVIQVKLTHSTYGSSIGRNNVANIIVPANDNPHGTVHFTQMMYRVQEPLEGNSIKNITVKRSGGHFGKLRVFYSTSKIDFVDPLIAEGQDIFTYYERPVTGIANGQPILQGNVSLEKDALHACAAVCLKEETCLAFSFTNNSGMSKCSWIASLFHILTNSTELSIYRKNSSSVSALLSTQATAGSDYEPVTGSWTIMHEGDEFANLSVSIQTDSEPERDEKFAILLLNVELMNGMVTPANQPTISQPNISTVVIVMNGDAFGIFLIYSTNPNATDEGHYLEVMEESQATIQLVIDRSGGSLGEVTVEWSVVGGTATINVDFIGDGDVLTFAEGENRRIVTLIIVDDEEPEDNETILVRLTHTEGGSRILPSSDTVTVIILANDYVAGVISFQASSRSVIGSEGESLLFWIERNAPGQGNISIDWNIHGKYAQENFVAINGTLFISEGILNASLLVHIFDDGIPEEKEEYRIILSNIRTEGVPSTHAAVIDSQGYEAVLTVEASDEPHGVVKFAPSSQTVSIQEGNKTIQLFVSREFGSLGAINITFEIVQGSLLPLNLNEESLAEPGLDFLSLSDFVIMEEGEAATVINVTILEDEIPELREFFLVNLTSVELIFDDLTRFPPRLDATGRVSRIAVDANDGVKGSIQWHTINFKVNETAGNLTLVIYRDKGTYGNVSLFYYTQNLGAQLGWDFNVTPMSILFRDGERYKYVEVAILDDDIPEGDEDFQLILTDPSSGLELGERTTATVTIFANDDGHGILSFNNTEHVFLKEPTALGLSESIATLHIVRNPPLGTFGIVSVQYIVTNMNGSDSSLDLKPTKGLILLEDGVRMKILQISAILDEEAEMDEQFLITLFDPTGGARLGEKVQTLITVLKNQAPLGLFSIFPIENRTRSVIVEEGNRTLYLKVSRSNGLENRVTVEWETQAQTAFGLKGDIQVLSTLQNFPESFGSGWCFMTLNNTLFGIFLRVSKSSSNADALSTLYQWQGVFVPVQNFKIWNPTGCTTFIRNDASYIIITHRGITGMEASNNSVYRFTGQSELALIQSLIVSETSDVKHFTQDNQDYLIISSQADTLDSNSKIYRWTGHLFILHQNLLTQGATGLTLFNRGSLLYLAVSQFSFNQVSVLYQWSDDQFSNLQNLMVHGATHVSSMIVGADIYLVFCNNAAGGNHTSCLVYMWETGEPFLKLVQTIPAKIVRHILLFAPPSGFVHLLLAGENQSILYIWNSATSQFKLVLELPPANHMLSVTVPALNKTKTLIAAAGDLDSWIFELVSVTNQSDFIPG
ncbi:hypothetical protein scyTo_0007916 [Scyliorhinus torazame]|uniref:Adhesion G-protein coupled receptor V1 n=1 Tax=Scyliorhinus torazame TaxID=75743 RepID=A0A401P0I6_SCYTO|nr:hypothetical protein [Scyliorhinus torazame]